MPICKKNFWLETDPYYFGGNFGQIALVEDGLKADNTHNRHHAQIAHNIQLRDLIIQQKTARGFKVQNPPKNKRFKVEIIHDLCMLLLWQSFTCAIRHFLSFTRQGCDPS